VRGRILAAQVVTVVGCHHRQAEVAAKRQELTVHLHLPVDAVGHQLHIQILRAKDLAIAVERLRRFPHVLAEDMPIHLTLETSRQTDQARRMLGQEVLIDAGPIVKAFEVRFADQARQVLITLIVGG
jgi:hypothetical protein